MLQLWEILLPIYWNAEAQQQAAEIPEDHHYTWYKRVRQMEGSPRVLWSHQQRWEALGSISDVNAIKAVRVFVHDGKQIEDQSHSSSKCWKRKS
jgi:hypothetical protein